MPNRSRISTSCLSGLTIDLFKQFGAERLACEHQENLTLGRFWMPAAKPGHHQTPRKPRMFQRARQLLPRRHAPLDLEINFPGFRAGVFRAHTYIIATGGAGSFGSPALASGTRISAQAMIAATTMPPR